MRPKVLPIEAEVEQPKTLVGIASAEDVREDIPRRRARVLRGQAEDGHGVEQREDVGGDDLVGKHDGEADPEESDALRVVVPVEVEGWRGCQCRRLALKVRHTLEDGDLRKTLPVHHFRGVHREGS